jgi:ankyrin repeat protein
MEQIEHQRGDLPRDALLTLSWIVNARRQLTVPELQEALAVEIGKPALDEDNIPTLGHITKACAPLIVVDAESKIVRLVHYTTQEFFERTQNIWFKNAQIDITRICITYLSFESGFCPSQDEFEDRLETNMLYDYAAQNWGHHACEALALDQDTLEVIDFLERKEKREAWSQALMAARSERWDESSQRVPRHMTALHLAGYFGLHNVAVTLLERGHDPNIMDSYEQTPLSYAVRNGHAPIVKLLLGQHVHPDPGKDSFYGSPLSWAARNGHEPVMKLLLEKDVDLGSKDEYGLTPLAWAAKNGHAAVVERLLERGASQETTNYRGRTALSLAAANGHEAVVKLLLAKNSNLEAKDELGLTPLARAARNGHEVVVKLLLAKNSNLEAKDELGLTPLAQAARNGREVVTKVLLDGKADVNAQDNGGTTVLHWATWEGHDAVVSLLLQRGAHTEIRNAGGGTALAAAIEKGSERIVKLLLGKGANVNYLYPFYAGKPARWRAIHISGAEYEGDAEYVSDAEYESDAEDTVLSAYKYYQTKDDPGVLHHTFGYSEEPYGRRKVSPLWRAAERSDDTVVKLLQDSGAHLDFQVDGALTQLPLLWAVKNGYEGLVRLLLERGEDPNTEDASGYNALLLAAENGHEGVVRLLLERGVDPNAKDTSGASALTLATKRGRYGVFSLLLASDKVDVDMEDGVGRTPLSYAAENTEDSQFVEVLLASGKVDPDSKDIDGRTPLSHVRYSDVTEVLLASSKVNIESRDKIGRTPLLHAAGGGWNEAVERLLEYGADRNSEDEFSQTPLMKAREGFERAKEEANARGDAWERLGLDIKISMFERIINLLA